MSHWLDEAARGLSEGRYTRRQALRRATRVAGAGALARAVDPGLAIARVPGEGCYESDHCYAPNRCCGAYGTCYNPDTHKCCPRGDACLKSLTCCGQHCCHPEKNEECCGHSVCYRRDSEKCCPKGTKCDRDQKCCGFDCCNEEKGEMCCHDFQCYLPAKYTCCPDGTIVPKGDLCCPKGLVPCGQGEAATCCHLSDCVDDLCCNISGSSPLAELASAHCNGQCCKTGYLCCGAGSSATCCATANCNNGVCGSPCGSAGVCGSSQVCCPGGAGACCFPDQVCCPGTYGCFPANVGQMTCTGDCTNSTLGPPPTTGIPFTTSTTCCPVGGQGGGDVTCTAYQGLTGASCCQGGLPGCICSDGTCCTADTGGCCEPDGTCNPNCNG